MNQTQEPIHLLEALPYPLFAPVRHDSKGTPLDFFGYFRSSLDSPANYVPATHLDTRFEQAAHDCWEELVCLDTFGTTGAERKLFAQENQLKHVFGNYFCSVSFPETPLLRATALYKSLEYHYTERGRISRFTAAWIWGYVTSAPEPIHIDFDRTLRLNVTRARSANILTHQVRVIPYDYMMLGKLRVTTPLRTALDLLLYETDLEGEDVLVSMLRDSENDCTQEKLLESMDRISYLRFKQ